MVTYNQWSYITLFVTLQAMLTTLDGEYKLTDFLLLVKSRGEQASWQENGSLTVCLQMVVKGPVSVLDIMAQTSKRICRNAYGW